MTAPVAPRSGDSYRSQNGEDRWLDAHFGGKRVGFFVEVGAYDGVNLSNTYHFEQNGWAGVLVEPDPEMAERCRRDRPGSLTFQCAAGASAGEISFYKVAGGEAYSTTSLSAAHRERLDRMGLAWREVRVPVRTLDAILQEARALDVDFVSIDVEGGELAVLQGFDIRRWKPAVVIVETNAARRDPQIRRYFVANGYAYRHSIDVNDFYLSAASARMPAGVVDAANYLKHRAVRRIARTRQLALRAWRKHVLRRQPR